MGHPIGILEGGCGVFPRETLGKMQTQCFTARQEAVMRIREGEARKESKGLLADLTLAAADTNPVMILIVGLFAPTAVAMIVSRSQIGQCRRISLAPTAAQSVSSLPTVSGSGITRIVNQGGSGTG